MKPAQPLDGHYLSRLQQLPCLSENILAAFQRQRSSLPVHQPVLRPALRAGVGLGVKPPVGRIVEFAMAGLAHRKDIHRSRTPIVRRLTDDCVARTAIRTIGEWILIAPVCLVGDLAATVFAGRNICRHKRHRSRWRIAFDNIEGRFVTIRDLIRSQRIDFGLRRLFLLEIADERIKLGCCPLDFDMNAVSRVVNPTGQPMTRRQSVDEWTKPDALDDAANDQVLAHCVASRLLLPEIYYDGRRSKPFKETTVNHA